MVDSLLIAVVTTGVMCLEVLDWIPFFFFNFFFGEGERTWQMQQKLSNGN